MSEEEIIEQLISLKHHCATMEDEIFKDDVKAIQGLLDLYNKEKEKNKIIDNGVKIKIELQNKKPYNIYIQETCKLFDWYINGIKLEDKENECNN